MSRILLVVVLFLFVVANVMASTGEVGSSVYGKVVSYKGNMGVEYVTVAIYQKTSGQLVGGTITKSDGSFVIKGLKPGAYYLQVSFVGFETRKIEGITIKGNKQRINAGVVRLGTSSTDIDEVDVVAERNVIEFKLDKKIVHVGEQFTSVSGTAVNVLENVPSVTVDLEGEVALRGSTGFTVLINGIQTMLEPSDALQQIPASTIENIEIITNPSSKYDPDGTSGIINVITKKSRLNGLSGVSNFKIGTNNIGGDFLFNIKSEKLSWFLGADYSYGDYPGDKHGYRLGYYGNTVSTVNHKGDIRSKYNRFNLKGGVEFRFDTLNVLSFDVNYGGRDRYRYSDLDYEEYNNFESVPYLYGSSEKGFRGNRGISVNGVYVRKFKTKGHELVATLSLRNRDSEEYNRNELYGVNDTRINARKNTEIGPMRRWQVKLDYTLPVGKQGKIEAGYQSVFNSSDDETGLLEDENGAGVWAENVLYDNKVAYGQDIHAIYLIYGSQISKFGYQVGLRGEYTNRAVEVLNAGAGAVIGEEKATVDRFDCFPSVHLSYKLPARQEIMTSYSRRIERSRSYHFEPFYTWVDAFNIRRGNSGLLPEYIDSYELNYLKKQDKSYLSLELYHRIVHNKIEWVRSVYDQNIIQRFPENVGKDYYLGIDATYSFDLVKWWRVDLSGSLYNDRVKGSWGDQDYDEELLTWNYRLNQTVKINPLTQLQGNWRYYSKRITTQGVYQPVYTFDLALKKEMLKRKLTGIVELRDVFATNNRENTNEGMGFKDHYYQTIHTPVLTFTFTYRFNNYKPDRRSRNGDDFGGAESME